jgi:hypothetical protein
VIYGETGYEMRKLKQTCSTRVFGLQYVFYGMSVGGGVSEIRLPVFATFLQKCCFIVISAFSAIGHYVDLVGTVWAVSCVTGL